MKTSPIEIDKYRNLRYDFNAVRAIEDVMGVTWGAIPYILPKSSIKLTLSMLWAGLKWEDENLSMDKTGDLATLWCEKSGGKYGDLNDILITALMEAGWLTPPEESEGAGQGEVTLASKT